MVNQGLEFGTLPIGSILVYKRTNIIIGRLEEYNWGEYYTEKEVISYNDYYKKYKKDFIIDTSMKRLNSITVLKIYNYSNGAAFKKAKPRVEAWHYWAPIDKELDSFVGIIKNQVEIIKDIKNRQEALEKALKNEN